MRESGGYRRSTSSMQTELLHVYNTFLLNLVMLICCICFFLQQSERPDVTTSKGKQLFKNPCQLWFPTAIFLDRKCVHIPNLGNRTFHIEARCIYPGHLSCTQYVEVNCNSNTVLVDPWRTCEVVVFQWLYGLSCFELPLCFAIDLYSSPFIMPQQSKFDRSTCLLHPSASSVTDCVSCEQHGELAQISTGGVVLLNL